MLCTSPHFLVFLTHFWNSVPRETKKLPIPGSLDLGDLNHQLEHDLAMVPIIILVSSLDPIFTESKDLLLM